MAGVGLTGVWRTGVWVEPFVSGEFAVSGEALTPFIGDFNLEGSFLLEATASVVFVGEASFGSTFDAFGQATSLFTGEFTQGTELGTFAVFARADIDEVPFYEFGPPGGSVGVPGTQPVVSVKTKPGDVVVINGVTGVACLDDTGRLVVLSSAGRVLCIIGPAGVVFP